MGYSRIDVQQARELVAAAGENGIQIVDVRDAGSFIAEHIKGALHVDSSNLQEFLLDADRDKPLLVYCYHGNMSQGAAAYFAEMGFAETFSLDGGFDAWQGTESWL